MYEFQEDNEATWRNWERPSKPSDFDEKLKEIGGVNRHGQPNLRLVWGCEAKSDTLEGDHLKYFCGYSPTKVAGYRYTKDGQVHFVTNIDNLDPSIMVFPEVRQEAVGLPRWVIEKWVSPEELERRGRFKSRFAEGDIAPTLREFPREGVYEPFFIVQTEDGKYRKLDAAVLDFVKLRLWYDAKPFAEREVDRALLLEKEEKARADRLDEIAEAAVNFDLKLPKEEKERREAYWANVDYEKEEAIARSQT